MREGGPRGGRLRRWSIKGYERMGGGGCLRRRSRKGYERGGNKFGC